MPQRPARRPFFEVRLRLPRVDVRRVETGAGAPAEGSRTGGTGTPRHSFRCPDWLWLGCVKAAKERGLAWGPVLRGYAAAFLADVNTPVFPDPMADVPGGDPG